MAETHDPEFQVSDETKKKLKKFKDALNDATKAAKQTLGAEGLIIIAFVDAKENDAVHMVDAALGSFPAPLNEIYTAAAHASFLQEQGEDVKKRLQ